MAFKVVQTVGVITAGSGTAVNTAAIPLKSGYLRISAQGNPATVSTSSTATASDLYVAVGESVVLKERVARQQVTGITTGTTTTEIHLMLEIMLQLKMDILQESILLFHR